MNGKIISEIKTTPYGEIQIITLSNPEENNAITSSMRRDLLQQLSIAADNSYVRGILLRGAGDAAFSSGGSKSSIQEIQTSDDEEQMYSEGAGIVDLILSMPKPVVAAVSGWCIGAGFEIVLACDYLFVSDTAVFSFPEFQMGFFPDWGGPWLLSKKIGLASTRELLYFGKMLSAVEAFEKGLVNKIFPAEKLFKQAEKNLLKIISKPAETVAAYKKFLSPVFQDLPFAEARSLTHESTKKLMLKK